MQLYSSIPVTLESPSSASSFSVRTFSPNGTYLVDSSASSFLSWTCSDPMCSISQHASTNRIAQLVASQASMPSGWLELSPALHRLPRWLYSQLHSWLRNGSWPRIEVAALATSYPWLTLPSLKALLLFAKMLLPFWLFSLFPSSYLFWFFLSILLFENERRAQ